MYFSKIILSYFTTSVFLGKDFCYLFIPVNFPLGAAFPFPLALLLLPLTIKFPTWSNLLFSACFAPTSSYHQIPHLEQPSLFRFLYSYLHSSTNFPLGATSPFSLPLLLPPLIDKFSSWSNLPFFACFAPTSTHRQIPHLEQSSLFRFLYSYLHSSTNFPFGATSPFPLPLLLLPLLNAKTAMSIKPMTVNIPTPALHFRYTTGNICPSFRAVLRAFHAQ